MQHPTAPSVEEPLPPATIGGDEPLERYIRHGKRYGVSSGLWLSALQDGHDLHRLARELGVKVPSEWRFFLVDPEGRIGHGIDFDTNEYSWNMVEPPPKAKSKDKRYSAWLAGFQSRGSEPSVHAASETLSSKSRSQRSGSSG